MPLGLSTVNNSAEIRWVDSWCARELLFRLAGHASSCEHEKVGHGSAADQGVRPTIYADAGKLSGMGLEGAPASQRGIDHDRDIGNINDAVTV